MMPSIEKTPSVAISRKRLSCASFSLRFEIGHVVVGITEALRLGEPHAVDDRGMVQRIGDDRVLLAESSVSNSPPLASKQEP